MLSEGPPANGALVLMELATRPLLLPPMRFGGVVGGGVTVGKECLQGNPNTEAVQLGGWAPEKGRPAKGKLGGGMAGVGGNPDAASCDAADGTEDREPMQEHSDEAIIAEKRYRRRRGCANILCSHATWQLKVIGPYSSMGASPLSFAPASARASTTCERPTGQFSLTQRRRGVKQNACMRPRTAVSGRTGTLRGGPLRETRGGGRGGAQQEGGGVLRFLIYP